MTIDEVKKIQADLGLKEVHVAHVDAEGYAIAHTDTERASGMDLYDCHVHWYLLDYGEEFLPGLYTYNGIDWKGLAL